MALYSRGLSTRDIQAQLSELYGTQISPTLVSRVTDAVQEEISGKRKSQAGSQLPGRVARCTVREDELDGTVQNRAVHVAIGLTTSVTRKSSGCGLKPTKERSSGCEVLSELQARGSRTHLIACCDGLKDSLQRSRRYSKAMVQTCLVHQVRHSLSFIPLESRKQVAAGLREIYTADNEATARERLDAFELEWGTRFPMIVPELASELGATPPASWPSRSRIRRLIYTTNAIESLNFSCGKSSRPKAPFRRTGCHQAASTSP